MKKKSEVTQYGFKFGDAEVRRLFEHKGEVCMGIFTSRSRGVEIYVSPKGKIRVYEFHIKNERWVGKKKELLVKP